MPEPTAQNILNLFDSFHPQIVDKFIRHCYVGGYQLEPEGKATKLNHATRYPDGKDQSSYPYLRSAIDFHLEMYCLAETLDAEYLKMTVQQKLIQGLLTQRAHSVDDLTQYLFNSMNTFQLRDEKKCIAKIITAAVLVHEKKHWDDFDIRGFWTANRDCEAFVDLYREVRRQNAELLGMTAENSHLPKKKETVQRNEETTMRVSVMGHSFSISGIDLEGYTGKDPKASGLWFAQPPS